MGYNMKELCQFIERSGIIDMTAEEIFNYSPNGELSAIWELFFSAIHHIHQMPDRKFSVEDSELIIKVLDLKVGKEPTKRPTTKGGNNE